MINCLILDDEEHCIDVLTHYINQCPDTLTLIGSASSGTAALNIINTGKVDLLFSDIQMPEISGLDFVKLLNRRCDVIFTTAYDQHAVEGFELGVVDYLLKPVSFPRFLKAIQKILDRNDPSVVSEPGLSRNVDHFYIKAGVKGSVIRINFDEIEFIECLKNYAAIHHRGTKTLAYLSLKDLEMTLPQSLFARVHKSFIVPYNRILRVENSEIVLTDNRTRIAIGESYRAGFWHTIKDSTVGS